MSKIERQVMASVGVIYVVRQIVSATALKIYALVASVWALGALVWVARIEQNFAEALRGGFTHVSSYLFAAVFNTTVFVQAVILLVAVVALSLAIDFVKSSVRPRQL